MAVDKAVSTFTQETGSTLDGTEQFVMFDSQEGKRALLSVIADYIANHGEIDSKDIPTIVAAIEAAIGTLSSLVTTDKTSLVAAINEVASAPGGAYFFDSSGHLCIDYDRIEVES